MGILYDSLKIPKKAKIRIMSQNDYFIQVCFVDTDSQMAISKKLITSPSNFILTNLYNMQTVMNNGRLFYIIDPI